MRPAGPQPQLLTSLPAPCALTCVSFKISIILCHIIHSQTSRLTSGTMAAVCLYKSALALGVLLCALTFSGFLLYSATDSFQTVLVPELANAFAPLSGAAALTLCCTWASLLAAALLTLALRRLPTDDPAKQKQNAGGLVQSVRRSLAWQLPPRTLWSSWCGGLSLAEALGVGAWAFMNVFWLAAGLNRIYGGSFVGTWDEQLDR